MTGPRCAQVDVDGETVTLTFLGDLTPMEAVAAFLRGIADAYPGDPLGGFGGRALLYNVADQLDPIAPPPLEEAAPIPTDEIHIGRSWEGHDLEDECPCPKAPCGLVVDGAADPMCDQHPPERAKTMRQRHRANRCPATTSTAATAAETGD